MVTHFIHRLKSLYVITSEVKVPVKSINFNGHVFAFRLLILKGLKALNLSLIQLDLSHLSSTQKSAIKANTYYLFVSEYFPTTETLFSTSTPTYSVKTDLVRKEGEGINHAVAMTIRDANLDEVSYSAKIKIPNLS